MAEAIWRMCKERRVARHRTPHLNGRQRHLSLRFTYVNERVQQASEQIQPSALIEIARSIMKRSIRPGPAVRPEMRRKVMSCSAK